MLLDELFTLEVLNNYISKKLIRKSTNPKYKNLTIYTYSNRCIHLWNWDSVTINCRGLIVLDDTYIIARGMNKFFDYNEVDIPSSNILPDNEIPAITSKVDGWLGILYNYDNKNYISTRGSFDSVGAKWAQSYYDNNYINAVWPEGYTPVFEIISNCTKILVDYQEESLILLALIDNKTGFPARREFTEEIANNNKVKLVEKINKSVVECLNDNSSNIEGYVFTYHNNQKMYKVKTKNYKEQAKVLMHLSAKQVYHYLANGQKDKLLSILSSPILTVNPLRYNILNYIETLELSFDTFSSCIKDNFIDINSKLTSCNRKEFALVLAKDSQIQESKIEAMYFALYFALYDGNKELFNNLVWKSICPKGIKKFANEEEL